MGTNDILGQFESWSRDIPRAELGGLLKEYVAESNFGSWEGFSSRDKTGIARFLKDMMVYWDSSEPGEFATKETTTNPVA